MDAIDIGVVQGGLFGGKSCMNKKSGCIWHVFPHQVIPFTEEYMYLPEFYMAHVRQMFLKSKWPEGEIKEYGIDAFSQFPLVSDEKNREQEYSYISKVHCFCEDHQLEEGFWDFYNAYTLPIAVNWCEQNDIAYKL